MTRTFLTGTAALLVAACGTALASQPHTSTITPDNTFEACPPYAVADGSTFEGPGLGKPTLVNPATGKLATPYFRYCDGSYQFTYIDGDSPGG